MNDASKGDGSSSSSNDMIIIDDDDDDEEFDKEDDDDDNVEDEQIEQQEQHEDEGEDTNVDYCCICKTDNGVPFICCDSCPRSFHPLCLNIVDPEAELGEGEWKCPSCHKDESAPCDKEDLCDGAGVFNLVNDALR
jgi:hypothetical protein